MYVLLKAFQKHRADGIGGDHRDPCSGRAAPSRAPRWLPEVSEEGSPEATEVAGSWGPVALNSWVLKGRETEVSVGSQQAAGPLPCKALPQGAGQPARPAAAFTPGLRGCS